MSNSAIGQLYKRIIDTVVDSSRADFEENGVGVGTIKTFQDTWQDHLSHRGTAPFPWDPIPSPAEAAEPSPATQSKPTPNAAGNVSTAPPQTNNVGGVHVKQEPGIKSENGPMHMSPATAFSNPEERAQHLIQQRRMSSLNTLQNNPISLPGQQGQPAFGNMPYPNQQLYQQQQAQRSQQQWSPQQQQQRDAKPFPDVKQPSPQIKQERPEGIGLGGTDGADEVSNARAQWSAIMSQNREAKADTERMRHADGMMRRQVAKQMRGLEAGGLLVPIDERYTVAERKGVTSTAERVIGDDHRLPEPSRSKAQRPKKVRASHVDGPDDDDDDDDDAIPDENAINSDLDDPADAVDDGNVGDEYEGDTIICLYDKVQRVKNKWKCVLKDGVVNADGKDYVFHKANGEFEW